MHIISICLVSNLKIKFIKFQLIHISNNNILLKRPESFLQQKFFEMTF